MIDWFRHFKLIGGNFKHILLLGMVLLCVAPARSLALQSGLNFGLGPLEIRDQFPVTMKFLSLAPENTATVGLGNLQVSYQLAMANTFLNSGGPQGRITREQVDRGLIEADFFNSKTGYPISGFQTYLDVESYRHLFKFRFGILETAQIGLDLPWVSNVGGSFDSTVEAVHESLGISNEESGGAFRSLSDRNQYRFVVFKDDEFLYNQKRQFEMHPSEAVFSFKWNIWDGSRILPALSTSLSWKVGAGNDAGADDLVKSGHSDFGYYFLISKGFANWIVYGGWGNTNLTHDEDFAKTIFQRFITLEYRYEHTLSFILQTMTQSSIFPTSGELRGTPEEVTAASLSRSTDVLVIGWKERFQGFFYEVGFVEDYNQADNMTDIVLYLEMGQVW